MERTTFSAVVTLASSALVDIKENWILLANFHKKLIKKLFSHLKSKKSRVFNWWKTRAIYCQYIARIFKILLLLLLLQLPEIWYCYCILLLLAIFIAQYIAQQYIDLYPWALTLNRPYHVKDFQNADICSSNSGEYILKYFY